MIDPESIHDEEWRTGWKSDPEVLAGERRFYIISELVEALRPGRVFDLGCGDGIQAKIIKEAISGITINGCDISPAAVEKSGQHLESVYVHNIDVEDLPEESGSYDLVLCVAVLEHLYDVLHAINEIRRILKPGGHTIIQVPNLSFWRFRLEVLFGRIPSILSDPRHLQCFNKQVLTGMLEGRGLLVEQAFGHRERLKFLSGVSPSLFSEDIYVIAEKSQGMNMDQDS